MGQEKQKSKIDQKYVRCLGAVKSIKTAQVAVVLEWERAQNVEN